MELDDMELIQERQMYRPSYDIDMGIVNMDITNSPGSFESNTLFQLYSRNQSDYSITIDAVIMDINGTIIAQKDLGVHGAANCPVEFIDPNTILVGSEWGAALWHLGNDSLQILGFDGHHDFEYNPNSNTIFTLRWKYMEIEGINYRFDYIREYSMSGETVWQLDTSTFISPNWWCPSHDMASIYRDITHSNTVYYGAEEDIIYYNSRNTNTFFKINHSSSEVIWGLGEYGNFSLYDINGNPLNELFYHGHSVEPINNNTFIIFDNDLHSQVDSNSISRILEIRIDEETMTANESWFYAAPALFYSAGWGDADRLPNGNRIGDFGYLSSSIAFIEVDQQKNVVWQARFDQDVNYIYGSYRLERFRFEPIITPHPDIVSINPVNDISWEVFYNFRNKQPLPGNYTISIDGIPIESGDFTYAKYWNPTTLSFDLGDFESGVYTVTLAISDGYGNTETDSFELIAHNFYIERTGLTTIEKTQSVFLPTWSGLTPSPLNCNIFLNGSLHVSFEWTGEDVILDPDVLDLGAHLVEFELINGTLTVFEDSFWLYVFPAEIPEIESLQPLAIDTNWSESVTLSWDIFDATGQTWSLYINGSLDSEETWTPTDFRLNWDVPFLREGVYNITLVVEDLLGLVNTNEIILTVLPPISPNIISSPGDMILIWGTEDTTFNWEIYGGTHWVAYKNGEQIYSGDVTGDFIEVAIEDWRTEGWRPGENNLTLVLYLDNQSVSDTSWISIVLNKGDPYADDLIEGRSQWYRFGENVIGAPDDSYTTIFIDYENGFITLDMGEHEEIIDGTGDDFTIFAKGDEYRVSVSDSLDTQFETLGHFSGTSSLDLSTTSLEQARYVRIDLLLGESIEVDAIEAIYYNVPYSDIAPPVIDLLEDLPMYLSDQYLLLSWSAFDATPWSYEVYVNSDLADTGWWYGSIISYNFTPVSVGYYNITILFRDAFDNIATDQLIVDVRLRDSLLTLVITALVVTGVSVG
ncbi:MAG: aryl-sulfate sulfotransferase, partial [Candidatus Thorarchaeota archaeon]